MTVDPATGRAVGLKSLVFAGVFAGTALLFYMAGYVQRSGLGTAAEVSGQSCVMNLAGMGVTARQEGAKITAEWQDMKDGSAIMAGASAGVMACPGWVVEKFCAGNGCDRPGASLVLRSVGEHSSEQTSE